MKKQYFLIFFSLTVSLFIYVFFRTEKTVINAVFSTLITEENYIYLKQFIHGNIRLHPFIVYSLPEGLWVFAITLTSKNLFLKLGTFTLNGTYLPLYFAIGLELLQLVHITNGRFDYWDIVVSVFFWILACYGMQPLGPKQNILDQFHARSILCIFTYAIVYLAHVGY
ncbi:hypothetical protein [Spongiimicrobium salis]|uniref:hypothetical protein n=1 Tax=Spongiimicrobium salis TaxID=1667022 RepID=UPI00374CFE70